MPSAPAVNAVLIRGGTIRTMDPNLPMAEAVAVLGERVALVGSEEEARAVLPPAFRTLDLRGRTLLPGFIDTHTHLIEVGHRLGEIDLTGVDSITELRARVAARAAITPSGRWLRGRGWDQEKLRERRYPTRHDLDPVTSAHPVFLSRICGHVGVANSAALAAARINRDTPNPPGGILERDPSGEPSGLLKETAQALVYAAIPGPSRQATRDAIQAAVAHYVSRGVTLAHCILGRQFALELSVLQELALTGELPMRLYVFLPPESLPHLREVGLRTGWGSPMLRLGGIKLFADGSLGARTAALRAPYSDAPETTGLLLQRDGELEHLCRDVHSAGLQLAIHAIGDRAVERALNCLGNLGGHASRHRIEHASVLDEALISRFTRLGVIASVQPHFVISDVWLEARLGPERARWAYPFRSLVAAGARVAGSSDAPVEPVDPILGIWAALTRRGFHPEEALAVEEAVRLYSDAAHASFDEQWLGRIAPDCYADMVVLSEDPWRVEPHRVHEIHVDLTIINGQVVWPSPAAD